MNNEDFFDNIDTEEKAYWFGFIIADGGLSKDSYQLFINLGLKDSLHLIKFANIFGANIKFTNYNDKKGVSLKLTNKHLYSYLIQSGVYPNKTKIENGYCVKSIHRCLLKHFIRGVFDGDGCITQSKTSKSNCNLSIVGHYRLLEKIKNIIVENAKTNNPNIHKLKNYAILRWSGVEQIHSIGKW